MFRPERLAPLVSPRFDVHASGDGAKQAIAVDPTKSRSKQPSTGGLYGPTDASRKGIAAVPLKSRLPAIVAGAPSELVPPSKADRDRRKVTAVPAPSSRVRSRRLTPGEFESLQGFPKTWTRYRSDGSEIATALCDKWPLKCGYQCRSAEWIGIGILRAL